MLYRGCQKKIIMLDNPCGDLFEKAYFIIREDKYDVCESDMVREANKIVKAAMNGFCDVSKINDIVGDKNNKKSKKDSFLWLVLGFAIGFCGAFLSIMFL